MATANDLIEVAQSQLNDPAGVRWSKTELLGYLNTGLAKAASLAYEAFVVTASVVLAAGARQVLPARGISLIRVVRDMGTNGTTPGRAARLVDKKSLDAFAPGWSAAAAATMREWTYDGNNPLVYWVNPPAPSSPARYAQIEYVATPAELELGDTIPCSDEYHDALIDYMQGRALTKDAEYAAADDRGAMFLKRFEDFFNGDDPGPG